jgi:phosphoribosylformimino-5-aminoimidazole carboxamide ribotide isomerase
MMIIPAIDLRDGRCVRLTQGRKELTKIYDGDPVEIAKSYEAAGAQMLHVVDLDGAFSESNSRNRQVLSNILRAVNTPIQFGGGLRSHKDVLDVCRLGVARVVLGTMAVEEPEALGKLARQLGAHRVAVGIDARKGRVTTRGWETQKPLRALDLALEVARLGVERIVYTDVGRDGMLQGVNTDDPCMIARTSGLKVTASGGVSSLEDLKRLKVISECGIDSVIVGKALYERRFTLLKALQAVAAE